ncbi:hypothetical protein LIA77_06194 [Sarocladium implicatum]|nr:hypothetical protein LIA77_06194 [Sarocladium implicatum]
MRCDSHFAAAACILAAAQSVQAGPLRWKRGFWERDTVSTPGEMPTFLDPTTLSTAFASTSTPSTITIIDSTPLTTTIIDADTTTPTVAGDGSGSGDDLGNPGEAPSPIFTTLSDVDAFPDELRGGLTTSESAPVETPTEAEQPSIPPPNKTSLELVPIPDLTTPEPTMDSTTASEPTTTSEDDVETPSPSSFLETTSTSETVVEPITPTPEPTTEPSTTTIFPEEPTDAPLPPGRNSTLPGAGTPGIAPTEDVTTEPVPTDTPSPPIATPEPIDTPPADNPQFKTLQPPQEPSSPTEILTPTSPVSEEPTAPGVPDEDVPVPQPTSVEQPTTLEQPTSPEQPTSLEQSTSLEVPTTQESSEAPVATQPVPEEPTSDVFTQTIGGPNAPEETPEEPPASPSTEEVEPTTTTTLKASQEVTVTMSPTADINPKIPTAEIQTTTMSVSPDSYQENLESARKINDIYDTLSPDMACAQGQVACITGKIAQCSGGTFDINSCSQGQKCFALPSETIDGVAVGCYEVEHAEAVLRGDKGPGASTSSSPTTVIVEPTSEPTQPNVIEPTSSLSPVVDVQPTEAPAPPPAELTTTNYFGTEPQFTAIVPITDDDEGGAPRARPTDAIGGDTKPEENDSGGDAENNADASRTTQTIDGTPTVSVTVTVTVADATVTVTEAGATKTVTEKETETVTVGSSGDRVDTVSVRN